MCGLSHDSAHALHDVREVGDEVTDIEFTQLAHRSDSSHIVKCQTAAGVGLDPGLMSETRAMTQAGEFD